MQELEKILKEIGEGAHTFDILGRDVDFVAIDWVRGIICKHMNDGWIPVEEKPTEDGFYVATMSGALVDQEEPFVGIAEFEDGEWFDGDDVVAWRPVPEAYRPADKTERSDGE